MVVCARACVCARVRKLFVCAPAHKSNNQIISFQVSKNFSDVFQKLVPGGKATLIMKRGDQGAASTTQDNSSASSSSAVAAAAAAAANDSVHIVDKFVGIGIKVRNIFCSCY